MPKGTKEVLTSSGATSPSRKERPNGFTCSLGDVLPSRGPATVTERAQTWAARVFVTDEYCQVPTQKLFGVGK